ncbi:hypothetical protein GUJ93_ZPchr0001g32102 [Zizania palustris]|uniref:Uncharacterized protein n=1 Tax=Zizania palustris TaxID=103762 RepID=A0A8J5R9R1_ZIZPA|nr:hypothetical protein GUJ93_ZPchr0001g32102 [Zizania palustris]
MPQVDLESLVCGVAGAGAGDRKVSCETVIAGESGDASPPRMPPPDPDFPPESITIPIGDEVDFSELNPIYDRDDSTKGSTNPKSAAGATNPIPAKSRSNSTRIAGAPAAATTFFGLPASIRPVFTRRRPSQGRILPDKRSSGRGSGGGGGGGGGTGEGEEEPRSPKVSCIGKVLSDRERYGRRRGRRWWRGLVAVFLCGGGGCSCRGEGARKKVALDENKDNDNHFDDTQPGIADMRRFKSGRRTASWVEEALAAAAGEEQQQGKEEKQQEKAELHDTEQLALFCAAACAVFVSLSSVIGVVVYGPPPIDQHSASRCRVGSNAKTLLACHTHARRRNDALGAMRCDASAGVAALLSPFTVHQRSAVRRARRVGCVNREPTADET